MTDDEYYETRLDYWTKEYIEQGTRIGADGLRIVPGAFPVLALAITAAGKDLKHKQSADAGYLAGYPAKPAECIEYKLCRSCQVSIPESTEICPHCSESQYDEDATCPYCATTMWEHETVCTECDTAVVKCACGRNMLPTEDMCDDCTDAEEVAKQEEDNKQTGVLCTVCNTHNMTVTTDAKGELRHCDKCAAGVYMPSGKEDTKATSHPNQSSIRGSTAICKYCAAPIEPNSPCTHCNEGADVPDFKYWTPPDAKDLHKTMDKVQTDIDAKAWRQANKQQEFARNYGISGALKDLVYGTKICDTCTTEVAGGVAYCPDCLQNMLERVAPNEKAPLCTHQYGTNTIGYCNNCNTALTLCIECEEDIDNDADTCPHCGADQWNDDDDADDAGDAWDAMQYEQKLPPINRDALIREYNTNWVLKGQFPTLELFLASKQQ